MGPLVKASFGCGLARTNDTAKCSSRLAVHISTGSPNLASGGAPAVGSVIWSFMVDLLTFDNDAGTKAGTYRNQKLDKKIKFMFLLIFYGLKWRRDRDSNPGRLLHLAGFQDQCIQPLCHLSG